MERSACAMCTLPLDVRTVTVSRHVRDSQLGLGRVWSAAFGVGVRKLFWHSVVVSKSLTCTFFAPLHDALPSCARFLDMGRADRASGLQTPSLKATLRTGASVSQGDAHVLLGASARRPVHAPELQAATPGHQREHGRLEASVLRAKRQSVRLGTSR